MAARSWRGYPAAAVAETPEAEGPRSRTTGMEIGTEISRKIRTAIKGKLQELGAYADEELPDYIMVMVANKKSQDQMAEDLALFLGNNTIKFTAWLHGVLDKLRCVTVEPTTLKQPSSYTNCNVLFPLEKSQAAVSGSTDQNSDVRILAVTSTLSERNDSRVSTSSLQEQMMPIIRTSSVERSTSQLTSAVKPLMELVSSEAVIDIKPEPDDLIDEDLNILQEFPSSKKKPMVTVGYNISCPSLEVFRPEENVSYPCRATENSIQSFRVPQNNVQPCKLGESHGCRPLENAGHPYRSYESNLQVYNRLSESDVQVYRPPKSNSDRSSRDDENSRKRKAAIISSVVKINKTSDGEEDDDDYGARTGSLPSSISVPAKPERRPTLPPSKQANKNLILKAITEAQKSVSKTTSYPAVISQRQTVPVAPRTRAICERNEIEVINVEDKTHQHDLQLQINKVEQPVQKYYLKSIEARPGGDTRSFILKKPVLEGVEPQLQGKVAVYMEGVSAEQDRVVQAKDQHDSEESSPKFIVTLDGIPSPPGYSSEQEEETEPMEQGGLLQEAGRKYRSSIQNISQPLRETDEDFDGNNFQVKRQKVLERCKYWPACKNGDECMYHHPVASCKTFPKCKFGDKCLFIHPNCKYDSKCIRPDCPYTHASKRTAVVPKQPAPVTNTGSSLCRFFPDCKKVECPFIHPKPCRFSTHCKRADCTFYHPAVTLPPRHALKWTRSQQNGE
ncbi:zinc finger CCCH domain-containing protein 14 isoform X1 [Scyliorhinus canicula]|uniref:zinc finger CCCH domain-containing protein 14 isoform X1 n=1 Tax=Scyliorhinus canicula TaxID=7830 RepID=UPI0018F707C9|nr:zinc finger CCCH domain-containing protein 14 isoform X1 [Scyliorhinus canicula]